MRLSGNCIKGVSDERSVLKFQKMASSELSIKGNCVNGRGESYSCGNNSHNDARNAKEGQNAHSYTVRGNFGGFSSISSLSFVVVE